MGVIILPGNFKREDLRIIKTHKALQGALQRLLELRIFGRLTVNDLCEEAQLSRTAFYAHFKDKYDLLEYWLTTIKLEVAGTEGNDSDINIEEIEEKVNNMVRGNSKIIVNLMNNADTFTMEVLHRFTISVLNLPIQTEKDGKTSHDYVVLSNFCVGGVLNWLSWQIKNKFPPDLQLINTHLYTILKVLLDQKEKYLK